MRVELKKASKSTTITDGIVCFIVVDGSQIARCYSIEQGQRGARFIKANPGDYAGLSKVLYG